MSRRASPAATSHCPRRPLSGAIWKLRSGSPTSHFRSSRLVNPSTSEEVASPPPKNDPRDRLSAERDALVAKAHRQFGGQPLQHRPRRFRDAAGDLGVLLIGAAIAVVAPQRAGVLEIHVQVARHGFVHLAPANVDVFHE